MILIDAEKCFDFYRNCPVFGQISVYLLLIIIQLCLFFSFMSYRYEYYLVNMLLATFSMQKCKYVENKT